MSEMANQPDWCPADLWLDTGMAFDQLYDAEPDLEGGCETGIRSMAARIALAERERCAKIAEDLPLTELITTSATDSQPLFTWKLAAIVQSKAIASSIRSPDTIGDRSKK